MLLLKEKSAKISISRSKPYKKQSAGKMWNVQICKELIPVKWKQEHLLKINITYIIVPVAIVIAFLVILKHKRPNRRGKEAFVCWTLTLWPLQLAQRYKGKEQGVQLTPLWSASKQITHVHKNMQTMCFCSISEKSVQTPLPS